jgi:broad specificity phosphatase PhoE
MVSLRRKNILWLKPKFFVCLHVDKLLSVTFPHRRRTDPYATPPSMLITDPRWPGRLRAYADVAPENIPRSESLSDVTRRVKPLWENKIRKELQVGHNVLVVGHGSTLLGLIKHIQGTKSEKRDFKILSFVSHEFGVNNVYFAQLDSQ